MVALHVCQVWWTLAYKPLRTRRHKSRRTLCQRRSVRACVHSVGMLCGYMPNSSCVCPSVRQYDNAKSWQISMIFWYVIGFVTSDYSKSLLDFVGELDYDTNPGNFKGFFCHCGIGQCWFVANSHGGSMLSPSASSRPIFTYLINQWRRSVVKYRGSGYAVKSCHQTVSDYTLRQWFTNT